MRRSTRAVLYGVAGVTSEILTTGVRSHGRDQNLRLTGTTYLWMFPIYGSAAYLLEPAHDRVRHWPWWRRGLLWVAGFFAVEAASGLAIKAVTGEVPWDYSRPRGVKPEPRHWRGLVRPSYAPLWFAVGLGAERLHDLLDRVELAPRR